MSLLAHMALLKRHCGEEMSLLTHMALKKRHCEEGKLHEMIGFYASIAAMSLPAYVAFGGDIAGKENTHNS